uniref:hypothetical protein n=1 Tax=Serratia marcescens TaxID=615 RepID=UPI001967934D
TYEGGVFVMELDMLDNLQILILATVQQAIKNNHQPKEWMSLKEGASYAEVSYNTFIKFREMGLEVEI